MCDPHEVPDQPDRRPSAPLPRDGWPAVSAIASRAAELTPAERRRLGRWTSATLRDPRTAREVEAAKTAANAILERDTERRKRWSAASRPLFESLARGAAEARLWRVVMLVAHLAAVIAVVSVPSGLPPILAVWPVLAAPVSSLAALGRGLDRLGAVHAALAAAVADRLDPADAAVLRTAWTNAIEVEPPPSPPAIAAIGALAPSSLLVIAFVAVTVMGSAG